MDAHFSTCTARASWLSNMYHALLGFHTSVQRLVGLSFWRRIFPFQPSLWDFPAAPVPLSHPSYPLLTPLPPVRHSTTLLPAVGDSHASCNATPAPAHPASGAGLSLTGSLNRCNHTCHTHPRWRFGAAGCQPAGFNTTHTAHTAPTTVWRGSLTVLRMNEKEMGPVNHHYLPGTEPQKRGGDGGSGGSNTTQSEKVV